MKWDWKREVLKMEGQVSADRTDRSKRTTSGGGPLFSGKFPFGPKRSIYVSTEISGHFDIMANSPSLLLIFGDLFWGLFFSNPTDRPTQNQETHSTLNEENKKGWPERRRSGALFWKHPGYSYSYLGIIDSDSQTECNFSYSE